MKALPTPESVLAKQEINRILATHQRPKQTSDEVVEASNDPLAHEHTDELAKMFGTTKAKALRRGAKMREDILRRKLPDF